MEFSPALVEFCAEWHLATLTTLRRDGSPHVVPVGFTLDVPTSTVRVITSGSSQKARNAARGGRAAVSQVDRGRWVTFEGPCRVLTEPSAVRDAEQRYATRYRTPRVNPARVVVLIEVDRMLVGAALQG